MQCFCLIKLFLFAYGRDWWREKKKIEEEET